jgi:hypothetical protein
MEGHGTRFSPTTHVLARSIDFILESCESKIYELSTTDTLAAVPLSPSAQEYISTKTSLYFSYASDI